LASATREDRGNTLILRAGPKDRFAETRVTLNRDLFSVHGFIGLEVIDNPADTPGPRADRAPFIGRGPRLTGFECQFADSAEAGVISVAFDVTVTDRGITPATRKNVCD